MDQASAVLDDLLRRLMAVSSADAIFNRFAGDSISSCPPILRGQMTQLTNLDSLSVDSVVSVRSGVIVRILKGEDSVSVQCYGRRIGFPGHVADCVEFALRAPEFAIRDLPGDLDDAGKLTLIRRLIREGLVTTRQPFPA